MEGRATVRRAREPMVEEAERRSEAARSRVRVCSWKGKEGGDWGAPSRERSWWEKVRRAGWMVSLVRWGGVVGVRVGSGGGVGLRMVIPPHCGMSQLVARLSFTIRGVMCESGT